MKRHFVSYPKSGRSWIRYALTTLRVAGRIRFHHDGFEFNDGARPPHEFDLDRRIARYSQIDRVIYLSRDPRDVMVSLYFQVTGRFRDFFDYRGSISEFIRDDYFGAENLMRFRRIWQRLCREGIALEVTYEQCHLDFVSLLGRIGAFYGFDFTSEQLEQAAEAARFDNMRRIEQSGEFPRPWLRPRKGALKVRRGVVGGYARYLGAGDVAYLNGLFGLDQSGDAAAAERRK